jgi:hypothetical protein
LRRFTDDFPLLDLPLDSQDALSSSAFPRSTAHTAPSTHPGSINLHYAV